MIDQLEAFHYAANNLGISSKNSHQYHYLIDSIRNANGTEDLILKSELFKVYLQQNICSKKSFERSFFGNSTAYKDYLEDIDIYANSLAHTYRVAAIDAIEEQSYSTVEKESGRQSIHNQVTNQLHSDGFAVYKDFLPKTIIEALLHEAKSLNISDDKILYRKTNRAFSRGEIRNEKNSAQNKDLKGIYNLIHDFTMMTHIFKFAGLKNHLFYDAFLRATRTAFYQVLESENSYSDDPQSLLHMDSHYHVLKFWLLLTDVTEETYHTEVCRKSHVLSNERLAYESEISGQIFRNFDSIKNQGTKNFAFRLHENEMNKSGFDVNKAEKILAPAGSLIILNTRCFHCRPNSDFLPRYAIHFELRPKFPLSPIQKFRTLN